MFDHGEQTIGNYRLIRFLERGGFAEVYLGEHIHLNTQAAVKVLRSQATEEIKASFLREAQTIAGLEHPHVVRILEFGVEHQVPFLIMSYAPNGTLRQRHREGSRLPPATIVSYLKQLASALQYAHGRCVIHRDVNPQNMLIGLNDEILLSDFGLAIVAQRIASHQIEIQAGTLLYMAPEQFQGKAHPASDQYALGIVVYEWLCGNPPFQGTSHEVAMQHQLAPPPSLREQVPTIPASLEQVVLKTLAKDPKERFASVQHFAMAFEEACQPSPVLGKPAKTCSRCPAFPPPPRRPVSSNHLPLRIQLGMLIGLLLIVVIGSIGLFNLAPINSHNNLHATAIVPAPSFASVTANSVMAGFDAQHTKFNPYEKVLSSTNISHLALDWTTSTSNIINFSPSVANSVVYVGSGDGKLYTYNALTGKPLWTASINAIASSPPAIVDGMVYISSYDGGLFAFDAFTGKSRWATVVGAGPASSPVIANSTLYVGSYSGKLFAFDAFTGKLRWTAVIGAGPASSPVEANGIVYVGSYDGKLFAFDAFTGKLRWDKSAFSRSIFFTLGVAYDIVYVDPYDGNLRAYDSATGKYLWTASSGDGSLSGPAIAYGAAYLGTYDGRLSAFNASTGKHLWTATISNAALFSPLVANGVVYVSSEGSKLFALSASNGKTLWSASVRGAASAPVVANSFVYVGSYDDNLYAFHLAGAVLATSTNRA